MEGTPSEDRREELTRRRRAAATYTVPEAAVAAIQAGVDMVQIGAPADQEGVAAALLAAVESGEISEERLDEAAGRVLELKRSLELLRL